MGSGASTGWCGPGRTGISGPERLIRGQCDLVAMVDCGASLYAADTEIKAKRAQANLSYVKQLPMARFAKCRPFTLPTAVLASRS
jgi:hypothetical protein